MKVLAAFIVLLFLAGVVASQVLYTVDMTQQAVITQFGEPMGEVKEPGLHLKKPFIQKVNYFEKRLLE